MCHIWSQWNSAEIIDVCCGNALQGARFGHNGRNVIQKNNSFLSVENVGCDAEWSSSYPSRDFNLRRVLEWNIVGIWGAGLCYDVNSVVWELVPNTADKKAQQEFRLDSKMCFLCRKHKQPIKLQPRKILWHIRSPKRLRNSAINPHKPDTRHNNTTPTKLCSQPTGVGIRGWLTIWCYYNKAVMMLVIRNFYTELCVFCDFSPIFVFFVKYYTFLPSWPCNTFSNETICEEKEYCLVKKFTVNSYMQPVAGDCKYTLVIN